MKTARKQFAGSLDPVVLRQRILDAEERSANWLAKGNEYAEKGESAKSEYCYDRSASWLLTANKLRKW